MGCEVLDEPKQSSLSATQEIPSPTAADVLEVFQHFQDGILERIDKRDENVLKAIQQIASDVLAQYNRQATQLDNHEKRIKKLEEDYNKLSSELTTAKLKIERTR